MTRQGRRYVLTAKGMAAIGQPITSADLVDLLGAVWHEWAEAKITCGLCGEVAPTMRSRCSACGNKEWWVHTEAKLT
jgi:hypothetical protein